MNNMYRKCTLNGLSGGVLQELFERELVKVTENIQDENTPPKTTRKITLEIEFRPHESREIADVSLKAVAKLAPVKEYTSLVYLEGDNMVERVEQTEEVAYLESRSY